jgi:hypothetical protein
VSECLQIVVAGGAGAMPFAGVGWQVAQYLEGFRRLGHQVLYLEDTQRWPYDPIADTVSDDAGPAIAYVAELMERCGLGGSWAYRDVATGGTIHGCSEIELRRMLGSADVLINLSGATLLRDEHLRVPIRVYLETDPVRIQIEVAQGRQDAIDYLAAHTHHFSYGENFGATDCGVPIERFDYHPTRPPVILDWWSSGLEHRTPDDRPFTTIANWKQKGRDIEWQGQRLTWSKHVEFERCLSLPRRVSVPVELALSSDDEPALARLRAAGWGVRQARPLSQDLDAYRDYIIASAGEFSVAKEQNVKLRSGWFSDRTATYLAAGRPAIVQDTAFGCALPTGAGLFAFVTLEDAVQAFEAISSDYAEHCRAARGIAEEYLSADRVLSQLLDQLTKAPAAAFPTRGQ